MLKILDKNKKLKYVWNDDDEEPVEIDKLIINDDVKKEKKCLKN